MANNKYKCSCGKRKKNLTQSKAHTKDLPGQTITRKSNIWHTHEKTIYAAVSQHIGPGQQKQLRIGTAQLTHANLAGQVNGQQSDKFGKTQQKNNGVPSSKSD